MKKLSVILFALLFSSFLFAQDNEDNKEKSKLNSGTLSALNFRNVGPALS
jgi:hypothetical protein